MNKIISKYKKMNVGVKASFWFLICSLIQKGISFVTIPIFTRLMTSEEYGLYSIYLSWESIISIFATLNLSYQVFNNGMIKFSKEKDLYTSSMIGLTFLSSFACLILLLIFNKIVFSFSGLNIAYLILMLSDILFVGIIGILSVRERYDFKYKLIVIITILSLIANPVLGVSLVLISSNKVLARVISVVIVNFLFGIIALIVMLKREKSLFNTKHWKYALKLDLPLIPHYLAMILLSCSDRIMIGNICGNSYVAFYSIAYNAAMIMTIFINSINSSFNPWIYHKLESKSYNEIKKNSNLLLIFVGVITILPMFFSPEIIIILGDKEYYEASYVMSIISASVFVTYLYSLFINVELFYEESRYVTYGSIFATVVNILLNTFFIKKYGYIAAGYTTLFSYIILSIFHYYFMKKIMNKNFISEIYDTKLIVIISTLVVLFSISIQFIYDYIFIRYLLFLLIAIMLMFNNKKILSLLKKIKTKR